MKGIDYILKFGFALALSFVVIFVVTPLLYNNAKILGKEHLETKALKTLEINFLNANTSSYIKTEFFLMMEPFLKEYFT